MKTILYVEDNEYNRKIVRQLFSGTAYQLIEATDGEDGVALAQSKLPDLVLMDVQLPKMSGLDATRALKADERTKHIPVIIITSFALSGDREKAAEAGATNYLAKPYSPRELMAMVRQYFPEA
jgi:two-component system cell cycle response regulator DivK